MTEQEIQAAAERVRRVITGERAIDVYSTLLSRHDTQERIVEASDLLKWDFIAISRKHPLVSPPPTLEAADGPGLWWLDRRKNPVSVFATEDGELWYYDSWGTGRRATGGLWQRVIGPFGMEGRA